MARNMELISQALQIARPYMLQTEVVASTIIYIKQGKELEEALNAALSDWDLPPKVGS